ncbi:MAG: transcription factor WhiB [Mycobacterium sp.]|nr:transcription factor WhiB [Mycobacterium sp.]
MFGAVRWTSVVERGAVVADISKLPGPVSEEWEWQLHGRCRGQDSDLFFHPEGERGPRRARRESAAKEICADCPVIVECRAHALASHEPYGVWGGLSEGEREIILYGRTRHPGPWVQAC